MFARVIIIVEILPVKNIRVRVIDLILSFFSFTILNDKVRPRFFF